MKDNVEPIDRALNDLWRRRTFQHEGKAITIASLVRSTDWRPLKAPWWTGKEVSLIGADLNGNFFLRHCDGTVRYWDHAKQSDTVVAPSVKEFIARIEE